MSQEKNKKTAARKPQNQKTAKSDTEKENTQTQLSRIKVKAGAEKIAMRACT
jgi:hypothetical protein